MQAAYAGPALPEIAYREGADVAQAALMIRAALSENEADSSELEPIKRASTAKFPISAKSLMAIHQGRALGEKLKALESQWVASGFTLTAAELLR